DAHLDLRTVIARHRNRQGSEVGLVQCSHPTRLYLTAPRDNPCTSLSWAAKPAMIPGSETTVAAAHTLARNRPCDVTKLVRNTGAVPAITLVNVFASSSSFQAKIKQISAVAAIPGEMIGTIMLRSVRISPAPSTAAASNSSTGMSDRTDRIIQHAMGRFIAVYKINR